MNKTFKPKLDKIVDLPYMILGKRVKVIKLLLNNDDDNNVDNIENFVNKFLKNVHKKNKGVTKFQIQCKFSSGKSYSVNAFSDITNDFEMREVDAMYQNIGEMVELNIFFS